MIMEPCVALKKKKKKETYVFISLFTWTFTVLQTSVKARPVREVALCIFSFYFFYFILKDALSTEVAAKSPWIVKTWAGEGGTNSTYSLEGWGVYGLGAHPLCQLALEWPCGPVPLPSGLSSDGTVTMGGGRGGCAVRPWCINQKALLSRALRSSALSPCLPRSTWGLPLPFGSFDM